MGEPQDAVAFCWGRYAKTSANNHSCVRERAEAWPGYCEDVFSLSSSSPSSLSDTWGVTCLTKRCACSVLFVNTTMAHGRGCAQSEEKWRCVWKIAFLCAKSTHCHTAAQHHLHSELLPCAQASLLGQHAALQLRPREYNLV